MAKDLSLEHQLVGDLFSWPQSPEDWDRYRLSDEQVDFFHQHGYLSEIQILNDQQIDALRSELTELFDPNHDGNELWYEYHSNESADTKSVLFHALGAWRTRPAFHDILWCPAYVMAASQLLGGSVRFWHDQLFCKPPHHGGVVAWHQDYSYWTRTTPMQHLTCWIGLDKATQDNGCLQYVPGSHNWPLLPTTELAGDMEAIEQLLTPEQWDAMQNPVAIELDPGQCAFHHPLMIHGSYENRTDQPRRAVVLNCFRDGTLCNADEELLKGVPPIGKGEKMDGQFFPLLFDATQQAV